VIRGYRERHRARARQQLHALIAQLQLDTGRVVPVLAQGEARHLTLRKAAQVGAELIVLAKQEPSWWVDLVFGSLTRQLLREAPCDLLVVPPQRT
jgi:universal stress protein E